MAKKKSGTGNTAKIQKRKSGGSLFLADRRRAATAVLSAAAVAAAMALAIAEEGWTNAGIWAAAAGAAAVLFVFLNVSFGWILSAAAALLLPVWALYALENYTHVLSDLTPMILLLNLLFFYLLYGVMTFLAGSMKWGYFAATLVPMLFGLANYFVVSFRGTPIVPWDFLSVGTAVTVAGNYSFTLSWKGCFSVISFLWIMLLASKSRVRFRKKKIRISLAAVFLALLCMFVSAIQKESVQSYFGMDTTLFTLNVLYRNNGIAAAFLGNLRFLNIEEPEGYSAEKAAEIAAGYEEEAQLAFAEASAETDSDAKAETTEKAGAAETTEKAGAAETTEKAGAAEATEKAGAAETTETTGAADPAGTAGSGAGSRTDALESVTQYPNIIVIMNEAFSDLSVWGEFETDEEVMPFFRSLQEEAIGGEVYVSVKGGNTANTEFEFLTGNTMGFLPAGSIPYQQYINEDTPSLASWLGTLGYQTLAIHPYYASGWDRDEVYDSFGFDEFLDIQAFDNPLRYRGYVSDQSSFDKIIEQYELKQDDARMFVFEVTMQNHGGYSKETPDFDAYINLVNVSNKTTSVLATEKYLTLMNRTDQALEELVSYFEEQEEPTVILMFGDHQPSDYITNVIRRICGVDEPETVEEIQQGYRVPFLIWSNYGLEHAYYEGISVNYLSTILLEAAGVPRTGYQLYLSELMETLPVVSGLVYRDAQGNFYSQGEESSYSELLNEYSILEYNYMVDTGNRMERFFGG